MPPPPGSPLSAFRSDPAAPTRDPYEVFGPHDYGGLGADENVLVFETEPFAEDTEITGAISAEIFISCDRPDADLWVKVLDVAADGTAYNLMSPGSDVQRASLRDPSRGRELFEPGKVYPLKLRPSASRVRCSSPGTGCGSSSPVPSFRTFRRNLHTGESEAFSSEMVTAEIRIHHDAEHPSRLVLPVVP